MTENENALNMDDKMPKMKEILGTRIGMYFSNKWNGLKESLIIPDQVLDAKAEYKETKRDESIANKVEGINKKTAKKSAKKLDKEKEIMGTKETIAGHKNDLYSHAEEHEQTMSTTANNTLTSLDNAVASQTQRYATEASIGQRELEYESNHANGEMVQNEIQNQRNAQRYVNETNRGKQGIISKVYQAAIRAVRGRNFKNRGGPVNSDQVRAAQEGIVIPRNGNQGPSNLNELYDTIATEMRNSHRANVVEGVNAVYARQKTDLEEKLTKIRERQNRN